MAATTITDLVIPEIWSAYAQENLPLHSTIQAAGVVEINNSPDVIGGDEYTREPKFQPLTSTGASEQIAANTNVSLASTASNAEYGVIVRRAKGWSQEDLAVIASGADPMAAAMGQFTEYWAREIETALFNVVKGAFGSSGALEGTHQSDNAGSALTTDMIIDAAALMGENQEMFSTIIMNSTHYTALKKLGVVDYLDADTFGADILRSGKVPAFLGMQIVVNNTICPAWSGSTYPIYLTGGQPFRLSYQRPVRMESDRDIRLAAGTDIWVSSVHFAPHVKGVSYSSSGTPTATKNPSNAQLATAGNWEKVATSDDAIKVVQLLAD